MADRPVLRGYYPVERNSHVQQSCHCSLYIPMNSTAVNTSIAAISQSYDSKPSQSYLTQNISQFSPSNMYLFSLHCHRIDFISLYVASYKALLFSYPILRIYCNTYPPPPAAAASLSPCLPGYLQCHGKNGIGRISSSEIITQSTTIERERIGRVLLILLRA